MGLWSLLKRLLFGNPRPAAHPARSGRTAAPRRKPRLRPFRRTRPSRRERPANPVAHSPQRPSPFAAVDPRTGRFLDLRVDGNRSALEEWGLPVLESADALARWLTLPIGKLAWLTDRFGEDYRPKTEQQAHYVYHWKQKRSGGGRLIEAPKSTLKRVQQQILREILDRVPLHPAAHAFTAGRSIVTNAQVHLGQTIVVKFDLRNFYASVGFNRVTAIFRSLGYNREAAIWLGRLTTSALPVSLPFPALGPAVLRAYSGRHLPQGAPTSPALANLSAFGLDVRLAGLARSFGANYTRYADDLTFSGPATFRNSLRTVIPLVNQVIHAERFVVHENKRKVQRENGRQIVTGVVVNVRPNVPREDYDWLKAVLFNCVRSGPQSQNWEQADDFAAVLRGRIEFVRQLNPQRGEKLLSLYRRIRWN